jgi:uncharacterized protein (TIGR03437 family)
MTARAPSGPVFKVLGPLAAQVGKPLNITLSAADPSGDAAPVSASVLPKNAQFDPNRGEFSWVPAISQIGIHKVHFTATNLAGITSSTDVVIKVGSDIPVVLLMENAASLSNDGGCSPGAIVILSGGSFSNGPGEPAHTSPLPTTLSGMHVTGNGVDLPLLYASEFQVNVQCPQLAPGTPLALVVEGPNGSSAPLSSIVQDTTPGIFSLDGSGTGQGAIVIAKTGTLARPHADGIARQPVKPGDAISIFATGLGAVTPNVPNGQPAPLDTPVRLNAEVEVLVNGVTAEVQFAGLAPGQIGLYQVTAMIPPRTAASDKVTVQLIVHRPDGRRAFSNVVTVAVAAQQVARSEANPNGVLLCSSRGLLLRSKAWRNGNHDPRLPEPSSLGSRRSLLVQPLFSQASQEEI